MGRKYNQQGYQAEDRDRERERGRDRSKQQQPRRSMDGPRSPRMPGFQEVMRCAMCGELIHASTDIIADSQCPKCKADLRSCKHCRSFDTGAQFECTQPITARVMAKDKRTDCSYFEPRTSVERETKTPVSVSTPSPSSTKDARSAFDDLFR
jgi:hypothetical protein